MNACVESRNKFRLGDDILSFASARARVHQKITAETAGELFGQIPDLAILALRFDAVRCPHLLGGTQDSSIAFDVESDNTCEHFIAIRVGINYCELKIFFSLLLVELYVVVADWNNHLDAMILPPESCPKIIESRARNEINSTAMRINKPIK